MPNVSTQLPKSTYPSKYFSLDKLSLERGIAIACFSFGAIRVLRNADGGGGVRFSGKKRYEGVMFNVIIVTRGGWGSNLQKNSVT